MRQGLFYILSQDDEPQAPLAAHFAVACQLAAYHYQQGQKVFIATDDQTQAFAIDEYLWQFDGDSFIPHNLSGEGPKYGAPVEIGWQKPKQRRQVLINLRKIAPEFAAEFAQVVDFVPFADALKAEARIRYQAYRQQGFSLATKPLGGSNDTHSG